MGGECIMAIGRMVINRSNSLMCCLLSYSFEPVTLIVVLVFEGVA